MKGTYKRYNLSLSKPGYADMLIYGDIVADSWDAFGDDVSPSIFARELSELGDLSQLDIYINSGGGDVFAGMSIINQLRRMDCKTVAHIDGVAASMAGVIALACDSVVMPANAQVMIHKPWTGCAGDAEDLRQTAEALDKTQEQLLDVLSEHSRLERYELTAMMDAETWFYGEELADVFDHVITDKGVKAKTCVSRYFRDYLHTPEEARAIAELEKALAELELEKEVNE